MSARLSRRIRTPPASVPPRSADALTRSLEAGGALAPPGPGSGPGVDVAARLAHLASLRADGVLSASEFEVQRRRVIRAAKGS